MISRMRPFSLRIYRARSVSDTGALCARSRSSWSLMENVPNCLPGGVQDQLPWYVGGSWEHPWFLFVSIPVA